MGYLEGFRVTFKQIGQDGRASPTEYPKEKRAEARAPPRPPRPQPLRGRHGEVHRLRAVRRRVPGRVHLRARRRQPARRPGVAGRALRLRLRDQLPALHPLRPVRRGVPDRGDHRDEAVRVLVHQPQRRDLHQGRAARRRRRQAAAACRGRTGASGEDDAHVGAGCAPRRRRATPTSRARSAGRGELGYGVRAPEPGSRRPTPTRRAAPTSRRTATTTAGTTDGAVRLLRLRARSCSSARSASCCARNPVHSALSLVLTLFGIAVLFVAQDAQLPRRGAGHRLRRRDRRAVPVRDHAARRRQRRGPRARAARGPAPRRRRRSASPLLGLLLAVFVAGARGGHRREGVERRARLRTTSQHRHARPVAVHRLRVGRSRSPSVLLVIAVVGAVVLARAAAADEPSRRPGAGGGDARDRSPPRRPPTLLPARSAAVLFTIGAVGLLVRRNPLVMFMCVELMLNAVEPHVRGVRPRARRHRRPDRSCSSCSWSPPPRSWSASASSWPSCGASPAPPPTTSRVLRG